MAKLGEMMDFHFDFWVRNKAPVHLILSQNAFFLYDKDLIQPGLRKLAVLFSSKTGQLKNAYAGNISFDDDFKLLFLDLYNRKCHLQQPHPQQLAVLVAAATITAAARSATAASLLYFLV